MTTLQFADTHNLVAFLAKPAESEGFEQIVDFLNAHTIKKKIVVTEAYVRRDLQLDDEEGMDCFPNATIFEELTRMGTMASAIICLATNQKFNFSKYIFESMVKNLDNAGKFLMYPRFIQAFLDNQLEGMSSNKGISVTPSHTKKIFANMRRQGKDFSGRETPLFPTMVVQAQEEIGEGSVNLTDPHHTPIITQPSSSQPQKKHKSRRLKEKDNQGITSLKKRVKKLEKKGGSRTYKLKRLYKVGRSARIASSNEASLGDQEDASKQGRKIDDIDADINITLVNNVVNDQDMFDVNDLACEEVFVAKQGVPDSKKDDVVQVNTAATIVSTASTIPVSAAIITEDEITLAQALAELKSDKGKGIMVEEPAKMKKKDQISFDKQEAIRLQAEFDEEERLAREKDEATLTEEWNDIPAKIEVDQLLAKILQAREQKKLTIEERAKLFQQLLEKRRKHFVAKRAKEKRNKPPTRAQQRSIMCTYQKNMAGWKPKDLKNKSFANIQELFDKAMKRVNTFVAMDTELVKGSEVRTGAEITQEGSSKRAGDELEQDNAKKQKMDDDQERAELQSLIKVILDEEEVALDAIPLATKPPSIVDFKILKEEKINYFQIIRVDGSSKRPEECYERVLWGDLKTMFEHHVEDTSWRNLQGNKVLVWKLFDSCRVHFVRFQSLHVFILVEKRYPLTPDTITEMLNKKLQADHWNEIYNVLVQKVATVDMKGYAAANQDVSRLNDDGKGPSDDAWSNRTEKESSTFVSFKKSSRASKLLEKLNDYVLDDKVRYGLNIYANHTKFSANNCCFISNLNKSDEPNCYNEAVKDVNWVHAHE
ncbi:hypothetical protein Tco_0456320 [Tanacetum coccineum]